MSLYIDKKYINIVSSYFQKFKWKSDTLANCRCKFCGDSSTNKNKARGYFFIKNNRFFYKCHNCGIGYNIYNLLSNVSPSLCKEYKMECFKENTRSIKTEQVVLPTNENVDITITNIAELPSNHKARLFVEKRKIPQNHWVNIGYAEDFGNIAEQFDESYKDRFAKEDRLVIMIKSMMGICGIQGRSFIPNAKNKYITLKKQNRSCYYNYENVDITKKFYVVEGPFDSMFLDNSIATLGMSGFKTLAEKIDDANAVYVIDNQPYNPEVVSILEYLIDNNKTVCIFPKNIKQKDINDMVLANLNPCDIIDDHTYSGLQAKLVFNDWKKYERRG